MPEHPLACQPFAEDLSALIDGELGAERAAEVRDHVEACAHCSAQRASLERVDALLGAVPAPELPADLRSRLDARIAAASAADARVAAASAERDRGVRIAAAAPRRARAFGSAAGTRWAARGAALFAAAAAALALYLAVGTPSDPSAPGVQPQIARSEPPSAPDPGPRDSRDAMPAGPGVLGGSETEDRQVVIHEYTPRERERSADARIETEPGPQPERIAREVPATRVAPPDDALSGVLEGATEDELAVALELEVIEDFDVIANLEILERLLALETGTG